MSTLDMNEYQHKASETAIYPGKGEVTGLLYVGLGLGEAGEVQGKIKKVLRDDNGVVSPEKRDAILSECGDVLWYLAQVTSELNANLADVAQENLDKLAGRKERGTLTGSGDVR